MSFKDQIDTDLDVFFNSDELADTATYDDGVTQSSVPVILNAYNVGINAGRLDVPAQHGTIVVRKSDVSAPDYRQTFTIDGVVWEINPGPNKSFVIGEDTKLWALRVQRNERFTGWRQ